MGELPQGANISDTPCVFIRDIGGAGAYREMCDDVAANRHEGFTLTRG